MTTTIAVLGLGAMGSRMASRLLSAGHEVTVYNRSAGRVRVLVEQGARGASTPRDAVRSCDVALSCVRDDEASRHLWLDEEAGALAALRADAVAIESSTLTHAWATELGGAMSDARRAFLDAPVVGSRPQADAGQLLYLVGGDRGTIDQVRDLLLAMGSAIHHTGTVGTGTATKLAVNALFGAQVAVLAEVVALLRKSGVAETEAIEILSRMPVASPAMKGVGALMAQRTFDPLFPIELVEKDFGYVVETGARLSTKTPTAAAIRGLYRAAIDEGLGDHNIHGVLKLFD